MEAPGMELVRVPLRAMSGTAAIPARVVRKGRRLLRARSASKPAAPRVAGVRRRVQGWEPLPAMPGWLVRVVVLRVADPDAGEQVSAVVGKALAAWNVSELFDDVELCARELWGNVVKHASAPASGPDERTGMVVLWCLAGERLRVEVSDRDERMPVMGRPSPDYQAIDWERVPDHEVFGLLESGRGLGMVQRRADALSWRPLSSGGKTVWCEFVFGESEDAGHG